MKERIYWFLQLPCLPLDCTRKPFARKNRKTISNAKWMMTTRRVALMRATMSLSVECKCTLPVALVVFDLTFFSVWTWFFNIAPTHSTTTLLVWNGLEMTTMDSESAKTLLPKWTNAWNSTNPSSRNQIIILLLRNALKQSSILLLITNHPLQPSISVHLESNISVDAYKIGILLLHRPRTHTLHRTSRTPAQLTFALLKYAPLHYHWHN